MKLHEECGIFGAYINTQDTQYFSQKLCIFPHNLASKIIAQGLNELEHRGHESTGIATYNNSKPYNHKQMGRLHQRAEIESLVGNVGIGHTRYSTNGSTIITNGQPLGKKIARIGEVFLAHNGNYSNFEYLKTLCTKLQTTVDSEVVLNLLEQTNKESSFEERLLEVYDQIEGANNTLILNKNGLYIYRDTKGYRPLSIAKIRNSYFVSSEDSAIKRIFSNEDIHFEDVMPGNLITIHNNGKISKIQNSQNYEINQCTFELVYFSRPDSKIFGVPVSSFRFELGKQLAREFQIDVDYVVPVPDSANIIAAGYSCESGIPLLPASVRDTRYGRSFISPTRQEREHIAHKKIILLEHLIRDKKILRVDDTLIRGTTSKAISKMDLQAGVKEINWAFGFPQVNAPCYWGADFPNISELLVNTNPEISSAIGKIVNEVYFLSHQGLKSILDKFSNPKEYCFNCIGGQ